MSVPKQKPGKSEQVVCTPKDFLDATMKRLGIVGFDIDLAASKDNTVAPQFYDEASNALDQTWRCGNGWNWCNPPYADMRPWVRKAALEAANNATKTVILVPASVGAEWWEDWVNNIAYITFLRPRLTFVGHTSPYPKDLALLLYAPFLEGGSCSWRWRT